MQISMQPSRLARPPACTGMQLSSRQMGAFRHCRRQRRRRQSCRASLTDDLNEVLEKVRVRESAMRTAAEAEDYKAAAVERDALNLLQLQQRRLALELDKEARVVHYEIGQVIRHRRYSYRGVIVGFDDHCHAPDAWIQHMGVDTLKQGRLQPFYHVLVDENDRPSRGRSYSSTYVAQENIEVLSAGVATPVQNELIEHNFEGFEKGRYKPKGHLRQQYPLAAEEGGGAKGAESGPGDEDSEGVKKPDA